MGDWANLPTDIFILIAERMDFMEDLISLFAVCKSWQSETFIVGKTPTLPPRFPWVMLPEEPGSNADCDVIRDLQFYSLSKSKIRELGLPEPIPRKCDKGNDDLKIRRFYSFSSSKTYGFELPEASRKKCLGAHYGWLVTFGYDLQINLIHPFSRQQITLPPLLTFKNQYEYDDIFKPQEVVDMFVPKVAMSGNPRNNKSWNDENNQENCIIVAIYGELRVLAFTRPGDEVWTNITANSLVYQDIVCYNGVFYVVDCHGFVSICDIHNKDGPQLLSAIAPPPSEQQDPDQKYLVESSGDLLLVSRFRQNMKLEGSCVQLSDRGRFKVRNQYKISTTGFFIYKLKKFHQDTGSEYPYRWTKVNNLDGRALFLGNNVSVSLPSSDCVKVNCIYFSEDDSAMYIFNGDGGGEDTGIFNMENNTIESHYASQFRCPLSPPLWYI